MDSPILITRPRTRRCIAVFLLFLLTVRSAATTVLVAVTAEGIIVASDSQQRQSNEGGVISNIYGNKSFIVKGRFVVACIWQCAMRFSVLRNNAPRPIQYDFETWIVEANKNLPDAASFDAVVSFVNDKLAGVINEAGDGPEASPAIFRPNNPTAKYTLHIQLVIAGYENGMPRLTIVESYLDWEHKRLIGPYTDMAEPQSLPPNRRYSFGHVEAIADVRNPKSYVYQRAMHVCPTAFKKFYGHESITFKETESLLSTLIEVEKQTDPDAVGGKIRLVEISHFSGNARVVTSEPSLPKSKPQQSKKQPTAKD